jgi:hypothetical protein
MMSLGAPDRIWATNVDEDPKLRRTLTPALTLRNCFASSVNASVNEVAAEMVRSPLGLETSALGAACAIAGINNTSDTNDASITAASITLNRFNSSLSV